ncbi:hypothetical protein K7X08_030829 [Anisodus acutangulus]|uniref:Uncharacterized protein n=1 Tax=Anisodus acutangulus TaxID=402998 RepID=A0A9Q1RCD7_9SOLA|nr:hypothetical protein K7X08_030829 [Anisodus acutangulus]
MSELHLGLRIHTPIILPKQLLTRVSILLHIQDQLLFLEEGMEAVMTTKDMKVEINSSTESEIIWTTAENVTTGGLARQGSMTKNRCLCSPTTHAGSFRCRLHRAPTTNPSLQRTKSIESNPKANPNAYTT